ncbi:MAG: SRPBCC domain-containing protein [Bacteroidales bacterium]|nr:SRPBCC domain-containing protein [Bacteroidales bacterium]
MKDLKIYFDIHAEAEDIYACFTNPFTIELWSGFKAEMTTEVGSEFAIWDGDISGINLEFEENKKIVQEWFFGEREEKSIVTIKIHPGENKCSIEVRQTNIPNEDYADIVEGWNEYYLGAIKRFLALN